MTSGGGGTATWAFSLQPTMIMEAKTAMMKTPANLMAVMNQTPDFCCHKCLSIGLLRHRGQLKKLSIGKQSIALTEAVRDAAIPSRNDPFLAAETFFP